MRTFPVALLIVASSVSAHAADFTADQIRAAVQKTIPWLEKGAAGSSAHNKCFTCHNHGLPIMALVQAQRQGFTVDDANLKDQVQHTLAFLKRGERGYLKGQGQGGQVLTAGYALWALDEGSQDANSTTQAVVSYLLQNQADKDHWRKSGRRPPSDGNDFTTTYVAMRALHDYCPDDLIAEKDKRFETVTGWLQNTQPKETEDSVFRLKALHLTSPDKVSEAVADLLKQQQSDGGWAQKSDMQSDAYATATVLATLLQDGQLAVDHSAVTAGIRYLLDTQLEDGTWHVVTRAEGFQPYYESGFPHGEDQFISMAASSWAVIALLESLPDPTESR
jgi:N-acyl-D-amino-acid deacylase